MTPDLAALFLASSLRLAIPLIFAATGELVSERSGVLNLSLEGIMLSAALVGALGSWATGQPLIGLVSGVAVAVLLAWLQAVMSVTLRANQIVVGIGFNLLALGGTTFVYREVLGAASSAQIPGVPLVQIPVLSTIPIIGPAFFEQSVLTYVGLSLAVVTWWLLSRTGFGISVHAVGEDPVAAEKAGVDVARVRYLAILYMGVMAGLAGCFISLGDVHTFTEGMTRGAGYLALAAVIFGGWGIARTVAACLLFGAATALQFLLPTLGVDIPSGALFMLPYLLALLAVAGLAGHSHPPAALGIPLWKAR